VGAFLVKRIHRAGKDSRFDELKLYFFRFWNAWNLQGLWISFTSSAAWIVLTSRRKIDLDVFAVLGFLIWLFGLIIEITADQQKNRFKADPVNKGKFINAGLWSHSRHPNYFGEITLWIGMVIIALPVFQGWQWIGLISPLFVAILLTRISGIPILEKRADQKWGGQEDYKEYKKKTPVLIPKI
jgi:steroid 5-alpha reductase family enzyme